MSKERKQQVHDVWLVVAGYAMPSSPRNRVEEHLFWLFAVCDDPTLALLHSALVEETI